jgi:hypothetical protein
VATLLTDFPPEECRHVLVAADVLAHGVGTVGLLDRSRCPARSDFASDHWKPISRSGSEAGRPRPSAVRLGAAPIARPKKAAWLLSESSCRGNASCARHSWAGILSLRARNLDTPRPHSHGPTALQSALRTGRDGDENLHGSRANLAPRVRLAQIVNEPAALKEPERLIVRAVC